MDHAPRNHVRTASPRYGMPYCGLHPETRPRASASSSVLQSTPTLTTPATGTESGWIPAQSTPAILMETRGQIDSKFGCQMANCGDLSAYHYAPLNRVDH